MPVVTACALAGLVAAAAAPAAATPARSLALAAGDLLEDDAAYFRWPGSARDHAGRFWIDSGRIDPEDGWTADGDLPRTGPSAGLAWVPAEGASPWTAAFAIHARAADSDHVGLHRDGPGASFSWLAGRTLGPVDLALTWRSTYGGWSSDADARDEFEHHRDDIGLGARFDLSPRAYLDVAGDVRRQRNRMQAPGDPAAWDTGALASNRSWSARARAFIALGDVSVLSIAGERLREDFSGPVIGETWLPESAFDHDNRFWRLGAAWSWQPDPDRLLAVTGEYSRATGRRSLRAGAPLDEAWDHVRAVALRLAGEQRLNWWLSLRASLAMTTTSGYVRGATDDGSATHLDAAGGLALHLGAWGADLTAGGAPLDGPWRWLLADPGADPWLHATIHHDF
jgi:hypothetical protein